MGRLISWNIKFKCGSKRKDTAGEGEEGGAVLSARLRWSKQTGPANIQDAAAAHLVDSVWLKMMNHHSAAPECDQTRSAAAKTGANRFTG